MKAIPWLFVVIAIILLIYARVMSYDMTEGQAFINYWWIWASGGALMSVAAFFAMKANK